MASVCALRAIRINLWWLSDSALRHTQKRHFPSNWQNGQFGQMNSPLVVFRKCKLFDEGVLFAQIAMHDMNEASPLSIDEFREPHSAAVSDNKLFQSLFLCECMKQSSNCDWHMVRCLPGNCITKSFWMRAKYLLLFNGQLRKVLPMGSSRH